MEIKITNPVNNHNPKLNYKVKVKFMMGNKDAYAYDIIHIPQNNEMIIPFIEFLKKYKGKKPKNEKFKEFDGASLFLPICTRKPNEFEKKIIKVWKKSQPFYLDWPFNNHFQWSTLDSYELTYFDINGIEYHTVINN